MEQEQEQEQEQELEQEDGRERGCNNVMSGKDSLGSVGSGDGLESQE